MLITKDYMVQLLAMQGYKQVSEHNGTPTMEKHLDTSYVSINCHEGFICYYLDNKFSMTMYYSDIVKVEYSHIGLEFTVGNEHSTILIK